MRVLFYIVQPILDAQLWTEFIKALSSYVYNSEHNHIEVFIVLKNTDMYPPTMQCPDNVRITSPALYSSPLIQSLLQRKAFAKCYSYYEFNKPTPSAIKAHNTMYSTIYGKITNIDENDTRSKIYETI